MATISAYHRPATLDEALALLARPDTVPLAGGTSLNPTDSPVEVVDLQAVGLDGIGAEADRLRIGATATLHALARHEATPPVVREAARRELPSTLRAMATVGGTVLSAGWESELLAALLAHDAVVHLTGPAGHEAIALGELETDPALRPADALVTSIEIATTGTAVAARVGRTPADTPIVAAVARRTPDGVVRLALSGVAAAPVLVADLDAVAALDPPGDFRGSGEYRRALALTLATRVVEEVGA